MAISNVEEAISAGGFDLIPLPEYLKGRLEQRVASTNQLIWLDHIAKEYCLEGRWWAKPELLGPDGTKYGFWFWTLDGVPAPGDRTDRDQYLPPTGVTCIGKAVQWYLPVGGSGPPNVTVRAFNMNTGQFFKVGNQPASPIADPPEAKDQLTLSTENQEWSLTAKGEMGDQPFHHWWASGSSPQAQWEDTLEVGQDQYVLAVAFYGKIPENYGKPPGTDIEEEGFVPPWEPVFRNFLNGILQRIDRLEKRVERNHSVRPKGSSSGSRRGND